MTGEAIVADRRGERDGDPPRRAGPRLFDGAGRLTVGRRVARGAVALTVTAMVFGSGSVAAAPAADGSSAVAAPPVAIDRRVADRTAAEDRVAAAGTVGAPPSSQVAPAPGDVPSDTEAGGSEVADDSVVSDGSEVTDGSGVTESAVDPADPDDDARRLARPVVVLYGDSLAWEARHAFALAFADRADVRVEMRTFGGTAICDWFDAMADDAVDLVPGMVVLEFSGNSFTPCMYDSEGRPMSGAAVADRYAVDVERAIAMFAAIGTQVVLAGAPVSLAEAGRVEHGAGGMNPLYRRVALAHPNVRYVDAGAAVLADGHWTATLPCIPGEPCTGGVDTEGTGVNVVRSADGLHFCPASIDAVRGVTGDCPVWASGAFRFGAALAAPVIESLDAA
jgi:hypothetical protein